MWQFPKALLNIGIKFDNHIMKVKMSKFIAAIKVEKYWLLSLKVSKNMNKNEIFTRMHHLKCWL